MSPLIGIELIFALSPQAGLLYPPSWLPAYVVYGSIVFAFAMVGVIAILRRGSSEERELLGMLAAIGLTLSVIHALAYVEGRHRWAIEPLLLLLTARGMFDVAHALRLSGLSAQFRLRRQSDR